MDYKKILFKLGQSVSIMLVLIAFIIVFALIMISLGPQAAPLQQLTCETVNATTFCHP